MASEYDFLKRSNSENALGGSTFGKSLFDRSGDVGAQQALSQSVITEMQLNAQRARKSDTVWDKIGRELDVIAGGTASGTIEHGKRAVSDPASLVKLGSSAAIATGLTLLQGKKGVMRLSAQVGGLAMAGAFATDLYGKGAETLDIVRDTWNSPENRDRNREHIKNTLGPFVVDLGIYSAGGAMGIGAGKYASNKLFGRENTLGIRISKETSESQPRPLAARMEVVPSQTPRAQFTPAQGSRPEIASPKLSLLDMAAAKAARAEVTIPVVELGIGTPRLQSFPAGSQLGKVYEASKQQVGKIEVLSVKGDKIQAQTANATYLGEGRLVTNHHVVENATDIYIMDAAGRAHKAHTVARDAAPDLAIVQLSNRESHAAFTKAPVKEITKASADEGPVVAIGHYEGQNALHASPGTIPREWRQTPTDLRWLGCIREGNCGGPLYNMNGEVIGIIKSGTEGSAYASPSWHFDRLTKMIPTVEAPKAVPSGPALIKSFKIDNVQAAKDNIALMFETALEGKLPAEFFHSRVKRVPLEVAGSGPKDLILKTQISPGTKEVIVEPIAFNGKALHPETFWPGTNIPMSSSRLSLQFDSQLSRSQMQTINDPFNILPRGFAFRTEQSYLSSLKPAEQTIARFPIFDHLKSNTTH